jgi:hypothetical protein
MRQRHNTGCNLGMTQWSHGEDTLIPGGPPAAGLASPVEEGPGQRRAARIDASRAPARPRHPGSAQAARRRAAPERGPTLTRSAARAYRPRRQSLGRVTSPALARHSGAAPPRPYDLGPLREPGDACHSTETRARRAAISSGFPAARRGCTIGAKRSRQMGALMAVRSSSVVAFERVSRLPYVLSHLPPTAGVTRAVPVGRRLHAALRR